jgi:hypothetical protein
MTLMINRDECVGAALAAMRVQPAPSVIAAEARSYMGFGFDA